MTTKSADMMDTAVIASIIHAVIVRSLIVIIASGEDIDGQNRGEEKSMRLIDADELMEHVYRDKLDTRELISAMVSNAPTVETNDLKLKCEELKAHVEYLRRCNDSMKGEIKALAFAVRCGGVSGSEVGYETD